MRRDRNPEQRLVDRIFDKPKKNEHNGEYYVAILNVIGGEGKIIGGLYVTQEELDASRENKRIGGCGALTRMGDALSETYARNPSFYGATFCVGCNKHLPVGEFIWNVTEETVGS